MTAAPKQKQVATLIAQFALAGHAVHRLQDGGFLACKFGHSYHAPDFAALLAFAQRVGVVGREVRS